jgi:DNA repair exonuclease SbcCD nuclease subunit
MSILFIGDPHFRIDNIVESQKFIQETERILQERDDIHTIVVLGDVLHTHEKLHTFALNNAVQFFQMVSRYHPTYCLVGNHDATSNTIFLTDNHWLNVFKGWKDLYIVDIPIVVRFSDKTVVLCPYVPDGRFQEALDKTIETDDIDWRQADLIVGHQLLDGAKMGPIVASGVEEWRREWPLLISGHIHDKQRPQPNLFYTGSSMQHAFGESTDKTLYLYSLETREGEEIKIRVPRKEILYVDIKQMEGVEDKINKLAEDDITVKVVIRGDLSEVKAAKDTELVKRLEQTTGVKSVVFKQHTPQPVTSSTTSETIESVRSAVDESFESVLRNLVRTKEDVYLESLLNNLLTGGEDLSDKDVFFV